MHWPVFKPYDDADCEVQDLSRSDCFAGSTQRVACEVLSFHVYPGHGCQCNTAQHVQGSKVLSPLQRVGALGKHRCPVEAVIKYPP